MGDLFSDIGDTLFDEKVVLEEEYQPENIVERDAELDAYKEALKDVLFGRNPPNVFVYGKSGLGKTAVTRHVLTNLVEEAETRDEADDLQVLWHNCNDDSVYGALRSVINEFRDDHEKQFPKKGLSTSDALEEFFEELEARGGTFLLVLDEIDHLDNLNSLLYELPRARSNDYLDDARIGVIGISNNYKFRQSLSDKVKNTLMETEISFSAYEPQQLQTILEERIDRAFVDGACDESAVARAATIAGRDVGNARQALDLLKEGGEVAEAKGDDVVTDSHVMEAEDRVERGQALNKIYDQTLHGQLILETVAHLDKKSETPVRSKEVKRVYEEVTESWAHSPLTSLKSIQNHLGELEMLGFLNRREVNEGRGGGSYYEYDLALDADDVISIRETIETRDGD